jgi:hypothetical protein
MPCILPSLQTLSSFIIFVFIVFFFYIQIEFIKLCIQHSKGYTLQPVTEIRCGVKSLDCFESQQENRVMCNAGTAASASLREWTASSALDTSYMSAIQYITWKSKHSLPQNSSSPQRNGTRIYQNKTCYETYSEASQSNHTRTRCTFNVILRSLFLFV